MEKTEIPNVRANLAWVLALFVLVSVSTSHGDSKHGTPEGRLSEASGFRYIEVHIRPQNQPGRLLQLDVYVDGQKNVADYDDYVMYEPTRRPGLEFTATERKGIIEALWSQHYYELPHRLESPNGRSQQILLSVTSLEGVKHTVALESGVVDCDSSTAPGSEVDRFDRVLSAVMKVMSRED